MRPIVNAIMQWLARNPQMRDRALDALRQRAGQQPIDESRPTVIDHPPPGQEWGVADRTKRPEQKNAGMRTLAWTVGGGVFLAWVVLMIAAYALWAATGDWAIVGATSIGRAVGLPLELAQPVASALYFVRDFGGPVLTVVGIAGSAVILGVTAVAARVLDGRGRG